MANAPGRQRGAGALFVFKVHRVGIGKRSAHGVDRNGRYDAREQESEDTNPDRECAPLINPFHL
jgi:hypothetical protein